MRKFGSSKGRDRKDVNSTLFVVVSSMSSLFSFKSTLLLLLASTVLVCDRGCGHFQKIIGYITAAIPIIPNANRKGNDLPFIPLSWSLEVGASSSYS